MIENATVTAAPITETAPAELPPELPDGIVEATVLVMDPVDRQKHNLAFVRRVDISRKGDGTAFLHVLKDITSDPHHLLVGFVPHGSDPHHRQRDTLDHYAYAQDVSVQRLYAALQEVMDDEERYIARTRSAQGLDASPLVNRLKVPAKVERAVVSEQKKKADRAKAQKAQDQIDKATAHAMRGPRDFANSFKARFSRELADLRVEIERL
jgi:hypothetical protein